jgi:hypothetical protein
MRHLNVLFDENFNLRMTDPNLNVFVFVFYSILFPLNLTVSKITQSDADLGMLMAFGTP